MALIFLQSFFFQTESKHAVAAGDMPPRNAAQQRSTAPEQMPSHCVEAAYGSSGSPDVLVRLDHVTRRILHANHSVIPHYFPDALVRLTDGMSGISIDTHSLKILASRLPYKRRTSTVFSI
jgi:hypothetical protein